MLFVTRSGEGVSVESPRKRQKAYFSPSEIRLIRARTFAVYRNAGVSAGQIAAAFRMGVSTVRADIAWLADQADAEDDEPAA